MKESKHQTIFNKMLRANPKVGHYELKVIRSFPIKETIFEGHQTKSLSALEEEVQVWKWSDADPRQKMCDSSCFPPLPAYVVFIFNDSYHACRISDVKELIKKGITMKEVLTICEFIFK
jgi:hypothetical protein